MVEWNGRVDEREGGRSDLVKDVETLVPFDIIAVGERDEAKVPTHRRCISQQRKSGDDEARARNLPVANMSELDIFALSGDGEMERLDSRLQLGLGGVKSACEIQEEDAATAKADSAKSYQGGTARRTRWGSGQGCSGEC